MAKAANEADIAMHGHRNDVKAGLVEACKEEAPKGRGRTAKKSSTNRVHNPPAVNQAPWRAACAARSFSLNGVAIVTLAESRGWVLYLSRAGRRQAGRAGNVFRPSVVRQPFCILRR